MIEKNGSDRHNRLLYGVSCDACSYQEEFVANDFDHLRKQMKFDGWTNAKAKSDDEWINKCPSCSEEKNNKDAFYSGKRTSITREDL